MCIFKFEIRVTNREFANEVKALEFDEFTFALVLRVLKSRNSMLYDTFNRYYDCVCERSVAVAPVKQDVISHGRFKKRKG